MAKFAATYDDKEFVQTVSAQIPWGHNTAILDKVKTPEQREWYIRKTAENGWSRNVLVHQIESGLYQRQVMADKISNFENRLPAPQSELATQIMKDPYLTKNARKQYYQGPAAPKKSAAEALYILFRLQFAQLAYTIRKKAVRQAAALPAKKPPQNWGKTGWII